MRVVPIVCESKVSGRSVENRNNERKSGIEDRAIGKA